MNKLKIEIDYDFCQWSELSEQDKQLIKHTKEAVRNSYANYSHFHVGAALQLHDGRIVIGANQENAAFPSGLCAERAAIFAAQSQAPEQAIDAIAVAAHNEEAFLNDPISPCGACRQVMLEMEDRYSKICASCSMGPLESTFLRASKTSCLSPLSMRICENSSRRLIFYKTL